MQGCTTTHRSDHGGKEAITCLPVLFKKSLPTHLEALEQTPSTLGTGSLWACLWTHRSCVPHPHYNLKAYIGHSCRHRNNLRHLRALPVFRRRAGLIIFYVGTQYLGFQSKVSLLQLPEVNHPSLGWSVFPFRGRITNKKRDQWLEPWSISYSSGSQSVVQRTLGIHKVKTTFIITAKMLFDAFTHTHSGVHSGVFQRRYDM